MAYTAHSEAPDKFHFWTAVSTIAGALRRHVWLDMGYFQWTPNFYIIFVAPPGIVSKSTTASIGMNLLKEVPGINFGPESVTWQSLVQSMAGATESFYYPKKDLYIPMSAITISSSEFGTFLDPNDREMVDVMVSLWDGQAGAFEKRTKTAGTDRIENPWINLIACTTPAWIAGNFPEYMIGGGFTSRSIFVYGEEKRKLVAYPSKHLPKDFYELRNTLIHDLELISTELIGEVTLSKEAMEWGERWYEAHHNTLPEQLSDPRFGGYLARKQTHLHKLATIIAVSERHELEIQVSDLEFAEAMLLSMEADLPRVFDKIGQTKITTAVDEIIIRVQQKKTIPVGDIFKAYAKRLNPRDISEAIAGAVSTGQIKRVTTTSGEFLIDGTVTID